MEFSESDHKKGDVNCSECWPDYPKLCKCGGLVHAEFGDESWDDYYLIRECDQCGDKYEVEGDNE